MHHIKHFSFDLWFTLIKSNPLFKAERAKLFHARFNTLNKPLDEVEAIFREVDLMCNAINEKQGGNIAAEEMYLMVLYRMNNTLSLFAELDMAVLYAEVEQLIYKHMPVVFDSHTHNSLSRIKQREGNTLSILSNTAFVKGSTLRTILRNLQLSPYFDFQIYSDEVGLSKPNVNIYKFLFQQVAALRGASSISLNEIAHIGDNPIADIKGAVAAGITAFQINSNDKLIYNILNEPEEVFATQN